MALPFDLDIYSWLFEEILKVQTTGDPVADSVYLLLLPLVVLYMYADFVISKSRFMGAGGKLKYIMMFIVGFIIIYENYYNIFATYSIWLLGIIMIYYAGSFILGQGQKGTDTQGKPVDKVGWRSGTGPDSNKSRGFLSRFFSPTLRKFGGATREVAYASWSNKDLEEEAGRLKVAWEKAQTIVESGRHSLGGGWTAEAQNAQSRQEEMEEELASIANVGKINVDSMLKDNTHLLNAVNAKRRR